MMRLTFLWAGLVAWLQISNAGFADTSVNIGGKDGRLGVEYRAEVENNDHGLAKTTGVEPTATTSINLSAFNLKLSGNISDNLNYKTRLSLMSPFGLDAKGNLKSTFVELAKITYWYTSMLGFSMGKEKVRQGGFEVRDSGYDTLLSSPYLAYAKPFDTYAVMAEIHAKVAGLLTLQLVNDVSTAAGTGTFNKADKQPAMIVEWLGNFGSISPLVQYGRYDLNHSMFYAVGAKFEMTGLMASLDYVADMRNRNGLAQVAGKDKEVTDTVTNIVADISYTVPKMVKPFVKVATFDVKQAADTATGDKDLKGNTTWATATTTTGGTFSEAMAFDDNAMMWAAGVECLAVHEAMKPYLAVTSRAGDFITNLTTGAKESRTEMAIKFGVVGEF